MKAMLKLLAAMSLMLKALLAEADDQSTNHVFILAGYSMIRDSNGICSYVNPVEFWRGVWKEGANGWRVQLRIQTNSHNSNPTLRVECGNVIVDSGGGYLRPPNGKLAKCELRNAHGNVIPPKLNAGAALLKDVYSGQGYGTGQPVWAIQPNGLMEQDFPPTILTNAYPTYPQCPSCGIAGYISAGKGLPPELLNKLNFDELYSITNEGDYTLTVQPVIYKQRLDYVSASREQLMELLKKQGPDNMAHYESNGVFFVNTNAHDATLHRVDLPSVTTKIHLVPNAK